MRHLVLSPLWVLLCIACRAPSVPSARSEAAPHALRELDPAARSDAGSPQPIEVDEAQLASSVRRDKRQGQEVEICGELFHCGAPVVLWHDSGGYNAYAEEPHFRARGPAEVSEPRYDAGRRSRSVEGPVRTLLEAETADLDALAQVVRLLVVHYDVCGTSRRCFRVLQDERVLSCHFLLDLDGTLYQTLDLRDQAWHAAQANPYSIGIEIAQIGARAPRDAAVLGEWYAMEHGGTRIVKPEGYALELRTPNFTAYAARPERLSGAVHGEELEQHDFTGEQYRSLVQLAATLSALLPQIELDAPRDELGCVRMDALDAKELGEFGGLIGHFHVTRRKVDPGPAFDWESVLQDARALRQRELNL